MSALNRDSTAIMRAVFKTKLARQRQKTAESKSNRTDKSKPKERQKTKANMLRLLTPAPNEHPETKKNLSFVRQHYGENKDYKRVADIWKKRLYESTPTARPEHMNIAASNSKPKGGNKAVEVSSYRNSKTRRLVSSYRRRKPRRRRLKV